MVTLSQAQEGFENRIFKPEPVHATERTSDLRDGGMLRRLVTQAAKLFRL
jgi:hypothetical protein